MIKAILQYSSSSGKRVFETLTHDYVIILRTREGRSKPLITVLFEDYSQLNGVLHKLNTVCQNEVRLVRYRKLKKRG